VGENLRKALETLPTVAELVTMKCDVELPFDIESLVEQADRMWDTLARALRRACGHSCEHARLGALRRAARYETILDEAALERWIAKRWPRAELFAFDTETTSLDYMQAEIVGVSFCIEPGVAAYVPLAHDYPGAPDQLDRDASCSRGSSPARGSGPRQGRASPEVRHARAANHGIASPACATTRCSSPTCWNSVATRHDMDSLRAALPRHRDDPLRGRGRQGREADPVQPGEHRARDRVLGRGCRRHAAAAPHALARDRARSRC
jgi:DNA polymerase-1